MFSLIKNLFAKQEVAISDDPFKRNPPPAPTVEAAPPPPPRREPGISVYRDEIIGDGSRLVGYRFQPFRQGGGTRPDAAAALAALKADNLVNFAQRRLALVPVTLEEWKQADFGALIAPRTHFLVTTDSPALASQDWLEVLSDIKGHGGCIALDIVTTSSHSLLLGMADLILIDYKDYSLEGFEKQVHSLQASHSEVALAALSVGSWAEHRLCQGLGIRYSLGGFAAVPDDQTQAEKLNQSRLVLIEMLNLLRRDAGADELVAVAKRDPGVAVKILDMANSPLSGLSSPVASIQQALVVLGRDVLYRWLSLGIYRAGSNPRDETLLEIALGRARFLELIGQGVRSKQECDELFLVGMLSLLDSLLGISMAQLIDRMALPEVVRQVLLNSEGPYGRFLMLAMASERGRVEQVVRLTEQIGIALDTVDDCRAEALAWADEAMKIT